MGPGSAPLSDHPKTVNLCEEPVVAVLNGWIGQLFDWRNIYVTVAAPVDSQSGQRDSGGRKRQAGDVGRRGPNHTARPASADASGRLHSRVGPRCRGASRVDPARRLGGAGGRRRVPHSGGVRGDIHSGTSLRPRKCRRTASVFIDLGLDGGPILLGLVAAGSGIPTAFLAAAIVTAVGAALLLSRPAPPSQRPAERSA
jgi:hypothetical protein